MTDVYVQDTTREVELEEVRRRTEISAPVDRIVVTRHPVRSVSIAWKDAWSVSAGYNPNDACRYLKTSYICKLPNQGKRPDLYTAYWSVLAGADDEIYLLYGEVPAGQKNGVNRSFQTANNYESYSLAVYLNGVRLTRGDDYLESNPNTFEMLFAPSSTDTLRVDYKILGS